MSFIHISHVHLYCSLTYLLPNILDSNIATLRTPANMLSAIAPRKDSAQSSKEGFKAPRDHSLMNTSPLTRSTSADIVTNDDRTKSPEVIRVLSPMRARRTPVLVNAPDVRWRLASHLHHMASLDSVTSMSNSASETSTVRRIPVAPRDVSLPASSASSAVTIMPEDADPISVPLPPSPLSSSPLPPPQVDTRFNEAVGRPQPRQAHYFHQPHLLSPVTEASSAPSIRSSITDLNIQDVATAERRRIGSVSRQNVNIVRARRASPASQLSRQTLPGAERSSHSLRSTGDGTPVMSGANGSAQGGAADQEQVASREKRKKTVFEKIRKSVRGLGSRVAGCVARKVVARVLAHGL